MSLILFNKRVPCLKDFPTLATFNILILFLLHSTFGKYPAC
jgi:hypothetical protein